MFVHHDFQDYLGLNFLTTKSETTDTLFMSSNKHKFGFSHGLFFVNSFLTLHVKNSPTKSSLCQSGFTSLPPTSSGSSCSSKLLYRFLSCLRSPVYRPGTVPPRRTELPPAPPVCAGRAVRYTDRAWRVCVWANLPLWPGRWSKAERGRSLPEPAGPTSRAPQPRPSSPPSWGSPWPGRSRSRSPGRRGGTGEPRRRNASDWLLLKNKKLLVLRLWTKDHNNRHFVNCLFKDKLSLQPQLCPT